MNLLLMIVALQGNPADERKLTPEELQRRKEEAFKDAAEKHKTYKSWKATLKISESNPAADATLEYDGAVSVKIFEDEAKTRKLFWEVAQFEFQPDANNNVKRVKVENSRSLYAATSLKVSYDVQKTLENYDFSGGLDFFLPQMLLRDGFVKELEKWFRVEIVRNPRYENLTPTEWDWSHLGFKTKEEFDAWWKSKKAVDGGGKETGFKEDRPFDKREDEFDKNNPRNKGDGSGGGEQQAMYVIDLIPTAEPVKRDFRKITISLRPADFLPVSIMMQMTNDAHVGILLDSIQRDPAGADEVKDDRFRLEEPTFQQKWPQKE